MKPNLTQRLTIVMQAMGWDRADLVRVSGESSSVVSQWLGKGSKEIKSIGKMEAAVRIADASGFAALWIAKGTGPQRETLTAAGAPPAPDEAAWPLSPFISRERWQRLPEAHRNALAWEASKVLDKIEAAADEGSEDAAAAVARRKPPVAA